MEKQVKIFGEDSHLEHAETGLDTLNNGVSAPLGPRRCISRLSSPFLCAYADGA